MPYSRLALLLAISAVPEAAHAQFTLVRSVTASGGGTVSSASFTLSSTIGQTVVGTVSGPTITINSGFWTGSAACPTDIDGNGEVNANDLSAYLNRWYTDVVNGTTLGDLDHDGETNANDISLFINAWYLAIVNGGQC